MTADEKLAAILAAVQTDPGHRGLARDPYDNLFTATKGDYEAACWNIAVQPVPHVFLHTGFLIPSVNEFETDGPLGTAFLEYAVGSLGGVAEVIGDEAIIRGSYAARDFFPRYPVPSDKLKPPVHIFVESVGPAADGYSYTMRGMKTPPIKWMPGKGPVAGRNTIGMGKIPHETIVKNIPNGDLIHCRVPTDHLIVAGVSNWGAYALAAGVFVLKGIAPPPDLFDPDRELEILEVMVREGPLVDGVTGQQTATVDGLTWDEYVKPLIRIREILQS